MANGDELSRELNIPTKEDVRNIENAPARKEAALMREQGETAEDYREVGARKGTVTTQRPPGRQLTRRAYR